MLSRRSFCMTTSKTTYKPKRRPRTALTTQAGQESLSFQGLRWVMQRTNSWLFKENRRQSKRAVSNAGTCPLGSSAHGKVYVENKEYACGKNAP